MIEEESFHIVTLLSKSKELQISVEKKRSQRLTGVLSSRVESEKNMIILDTFMTSLQQLGMKMKSHEEAQSNLLLKVRSLQGLPVLSNGDQSNMFFSHTRERKAVQKLITNSSEVNSEHDIQHYYSSPHALATHASRVERHGTSSTSSVTRSRLLSITAKKIEPPQKEEHIHLLNCRRAGNSSNDKKGVNKTLLDQNDYTENSVDRSMSKVMHPGNFSNSNRRKESVLTVNDHNITKKKETKDDQIIQEDILQPISSDELDVTVALSSVCESPPRNELCSTHSNFLEVKERKPCDTVLPSTHHMQYSHNDQKINIAESKTLLLARLQASSVVKK
ncbi:hypothetical protein LSM04_002059 [Trypanosoma melophagium]|uniref:uncharacterized protein n=1 Tax=Trypanosoma melophagium TaxID=715481 RepID=UPI00351A8CC3|nr:hypothetical protein LSM04_002059 [Trypanosoma melophagium]